MPTPFHTAISTLKSGSVTNIQNALIVRVNNTFKGLILSLYYPWIKSRLPKHRLASTPCQQKKTLPCCHLPSPYPVSYCCTHKKHFKENILLLFAPGYWNDEIGCISFFSLNSWSRRRRNILISNIEQWNLLKEAEIQVEKLVKIFLFLANIRKIYILFRSKIGPKRSKVGPFWGVIFLENTSRKFNFRS